MTDIWTMIVTPPHNVFTHTMDKILQHFAPQADKIEPSYSRKHAELENDHPDAARGPNRPETAKKTETGSKSPGVAEFDSSTE